MALHRLTSIRLGVPDVLQSSAFFTDFGLDQSTDGWLTTRDGGAQVELAAAPRRQLQRLGIAVDDADDLGRIVSRVTSIGLGSVVSQDDERVVLTEPVTGLAVEVSVAPRITSSASAEAPNSPAASPRFNVPAASVLQPDRVRPSNLSHVVYGTPDQPTTLKFFTDVVGFEISDQVPGIIAFTRCGEVHHNLALQAGPIAFLHHVAFEVDTVDDVVRGGSAMVEADPDRHVWGVGRHAIGSNWFWYLREPSGTYVEYAADIDRISSQDEYRPKDWVGHEFLYSYGPSTPGEFLHPRDLDELIAAAAS